MAGLDWGRFELIWHFWAIYQFCNHDEDTVEKVIAMNLLNNMWTDDQGQDVAEYAVMLAVILMIVIGTLSLIGGKSNKQRVFRSCIQPPWITMRQSRVLLCEPAGRTRRMVSVGRVPRSPAQRSNCR